MLSNSIFSQRLTNRTLDSPSSDFLITRMSNRHRTEWSPIRSVIIRVITKSDDRAAGVLFVYHELDDTKSYYNLIIKNYKKTDKGGVNCLIVWLFDLNYNFECDWLILTIALNVIGLLKCPITNCPTTNCPITNELVENRIFFKTNHKRGNFNFMMNLINLS